MTFEQLTAEIKALSTLKGVDTSTIGHSVQGRPIHAFHVGTYSKPQIIITGAIHAREWITALLLVELVKIYRAAPYGIYFIPLCNPDGVRIALTSEPLWKANARGVDLNVNFDADWGGGAQNVRTPGSENFIGFHPNSEPEVKALTDFTLQIQPQATIAYHSKGEVIYHGFEPSGKRTLRKQLLRDARLADEVGKITGYAPVKTANSTGGYSDWVSMNLEIPTLTIEVGNDNLSHPITREHLPEILAQNKDVPKILLNRLI